MRLFLVANLYPSDDQPHYGVFVQNMEVALVRHGATVAHRAVIRGKRYGLRRLLAYLWLYARIVWRGVFGRFDGWYVHYPVLVAPAVALAWALRRRPLVLNFHGSDVFSEARGHRVFRPVQRWLARRATVCVVPSAYFAGVVRDRLGVDESRLFISPSGGIDTQRFTPIDRDACRVPLGIDPKALVIGFVSALTHGKGWDLYLEALAALVEARPDRQVRGLLVGAGPDEEAVALACARLGLDEVVLRHAPVGQAELARLFSAMDLFVCSTRLRESLGLVGLEAMACGVPVIGADISAPPEYIPSGGGWLFEAGSAEALSRTLRSAVDALSTERDQRARQARARAQQYDAQTTAARLFAELSDRLARDS